MNIRKMAITVFALLCVIISPLSFAHSLKVFAYFEGDKVTGNVYFASGKAVKSASVILNDAQNQPLQSLKTNDEGKFVSEPLSVEYVKVIADAHDGHLGSKSIERSVSVTPSKVKDLKAPATKTDVTGISEARLTLLVEEAVARQVASLREELDRYRSAARFSDIMGGLGCIVGIAGAMLWASSRKRGK